MAQIEIRMDKKRLTESVTVDEFIAMQEGNLKMIAAVISQFVWADGQYLPPEKARPLVGKMTIEQLMESGRVFTGKAEELAVPLVSGTVSE